jgi:hypothetical protein
MKANKIKSQQQNDTVRAQLYRIDPKSLKPLVTRNIKNNNADMFSYDSYNSFPASVKEMYKHIFKSAPDSDEKVKCDVYPPLCTDKIVVGSMSDKIAFFAYGKEGVIKCEVNPTLISMAGIAIPKNAALRTKEIVFRAEGSYYIDGYPFSLVSDYSEQTGRHVIEGYKGGRRDIINIATDRRGRWLMIFSQTSGQKTVEKIIRTVKAVSGKDINGEADMASQTLFDSIRGTSSTTGVDASVAALAAEFDTDSDEE